MKVNKKNNFLVINKSNLKNHDTLYKRTITQGPYHLKYCYSKIFDLSIHIEFGV